MTGRSSTTCTLGDITVEASPDPDRPVRIHLPQTDLTREQALHLHLVLGAHLAQTMRATPVRSTDG
ncbi:hypothetical protein B4N89_13410 [Embleya scabrispora]|uniref:Uncharacterized protein n=1 Tax=Embleya scabrispora TaxID=159449 RepID=A0A1T3NY93_9ACTN|nr:hypothetical protein [Embleya scabrispora]OPC81798.1 hypothetical protein B4N89_13410 [Embleya scabrispora]